MGTLFDPPLHKKMAGFGCIIQEYREFLFAPATLITLSCGILLIAAIVFQPSGILEETDLTESSGWLYLASALVGS